MANKCILKGCTGNLYYYDGALGYEAFVCDKCGSHYTNGNTIWVGDEYRKKHKW